MVGVASGLLQQHWLVSTCAATGCWALSDICCDSCIGTTTTTTTTEDVEGAKITKPRLTPEQNAMISGCVSLLAAGLLIGMIGPDVTKGSHRDAGIAVVAGLVHFVAYAVELRAYRTLSSTVITPLLQLSAVWMALLRTIQPLLASALPHKEVKRGGPKISLGLPKDDIDALYVATAAMRPSHLVAVVLVFIGGFLPAARGKLSRFLDTNFYNQDAVHSCLVGELLVCFYNALLHMCTFRESLVAEEDTSGRRRTFGPSSLEWEWEWTPVVTTTLDRSEDQVDASRGDVLRFFAISRVGTFAAMALVVGFSCAPGFSKRDFIDLRKCDRMYLGIALLGEVLSVTGVCIVMFSYATFHEPAVVNAAEGGVQQLLNLIFAIALKKCVGLGRTVEDFYTKFVSFTLVSAGLALSCR